jgi:hypothetical protein
MKKPSLFIMMLLTSLAVNAQIRNDDNPKLGQWDFNPKKIWEIDKAGEIEFGRVAELLVSDHGNIYMRDFEHNISYIFDSDGHFIGSFARQGTANGELSRYLNRFLAENKIVLGTPETLCFYSEDGVFLTSFENNLFMRFPLVFLNEREFIYAPTLPRSPVNQKKLMRYNLHSGEDKQILDFAENATATEAETPAPMIMIFALTPQIRLTVHEDRLCFGRSDAYTLYVADLQGNIDFSFSLTRQTKEVTLEDKKSHFQGSRIPQNRIDSLIQQLPDKMTYFSQISSAGELFYVYAVNNIKQAQTQQNFDIFSNKGRYLYQGILKFGEDVTFASPSNLVIHNDYAYVVLNSKEGAQSLAKYKIIHPSTQH